MFPFTFSYGVGLHFLGWRKERVSTGSRRPVYYQLLQSFIGSLPDICASPYETLIFSTVFGLAFFGAFGACELVPLSQCPVILVLHAGGNDLCSVRMGELLTLMQADVNRFFCFVPELVLMWSEIVPRLVWRGARDMSAVDGSQRNVTARMARFVRNRGGVVVRHRQLEGDLAGLIRPDGKHLTEIGLDIFLSGLQDGIECALFLLSGGRSAV